MLNYIDGYKFSEIADFAIDLDRQDFSLKMLNQNSIIYCKTDFLPQLFNHLRFSGRKYILITHMSDYPINETRFESRPDSIVKWYAENAIYDHNDLISIPIGLENHTGSSKGKFTNHKWLEENIDDLKNTTKKLALYCNWNSNTNPTRKNISSILKQNHLSIVEEYGLNYENYCSSMSKHKFIVCPPGNGVDTHRLWEALYLGCYPITLKHRIYKDFNLPILQIEKWSDITSDLLNDFINKWENQEYYHKLRMDYWSNKILTEFSVINNRI